MKHVHVYALLMFVFCTSCNRQDKTDSPKDDIKSEIKDAITSREFNGVTRNIMKDRKGNIWIAAADGVFRYDGKWFTNITSKVSSGPFSSVLEDRKGNFWFSSIFSGVYYYDGKSFQNFTTQQGLVNGVIDMYEDKTGNIWFSSQIGARRYDGNSFQTYRPNGGLPDNGVHSIHNDVNSIIEDKTGKFWFGTRGHACTYDGKTFTVFTNKGKPFTNVRTIIEDKKGNIWLGGNDGLWRYDGSTFTNFTQHHVVYIYEDKKGNIWTSSVRANDRIWILSRYDGKSLSNKKPIVTEINPKKGKVIYEILEDDEGNILFCAGSIYRYDGNIITDVKGIADTK